jgi:DNA-binding protein HU-beta
MRGNVSKRLILRYKRASLIRSDDSNRVKTMAKAVKKTATKAAPKATKAAAATKAKVDVITIRHIATGIAETHGITKKQANEIFEEFVAAVVKGLKKGARIRLTGLGILQVRKRAARMGRNPATGEAIKIKASKKVAFRVAKEVKESI